MNDRPICEFYTCKQYGKHDSCYVGKRAYRTCIHKEFPKPIRSPLDHFPIIVDESVATEDLVQRVREVFGKLETTEEE